MAKKEGNHDFLIVKVQENAITKSSSSDEIGVKNLVFMRVTSKFV